MNSMASAIDYSAPPLVARYSPVFWEPVAGTDERIVALISIEPDARSTLPIPPGTHVVIPADRVRAMLGRQRGTASSALLNEIAEFMTACQLAGQSLEKLDVPFVGLKVGPSMVARGYSVDQLIDSAVRSVSAFGNADDLLDDGEGTSSSRNTVKTAEFLRSVRRYVAGDDDQVKARFEKKLKPKNGLPDLTVDYAFNKWMVQVTSLPTTPRQAVHSIREAQSKLYELDLIRRGMEGNAVSPILMVNEDAFLTATTTQQRDQAEQMLSRLKQLAKSDVLELVETSSPEEAAQVILALK